MIAKSKSEKGTPKSASKKAGDAGTTLAKEEEHILRCLGAAVIMQWRDLPAEIQRHLFDHAIAMGKPHRTGELKKQIARFLRRFSRVNAP